ncbi:MAG: class I SAM-dependent methyltransferase [Halanaeroarchaeum sp.]
MTDEPPDRDRASVVRTYDRIATHFAEKRENPWPEVVDFLEDRRADRALDVGCANGRHTELLAGVAETVVGLDASRRLLQVASDRRRTHGFDAELVHGDAARLPLRSDAIDLALYVATLHHLPDRQTRVASLDELARVLAGGAPALVSVWSTDHDRFDRSTAFDTTVSFTLPDGTTVPRFYHIYDPVAFQSELSATGLGVDRTWVSHGNCYAVVRGPES